MRGIVARWVSRALLACVIVGVDPLSTFAQATTVLMAPPSLSTDQTTQLTAWLGGFITIATQVFFYVVNAMIGLWFLKKATRRIFGGA
jgi:hypothetical protein